MTETHKEMEAAQPLSPVEEGVPEGTGDPYVRGIHAGVEAAAVLVVGWREIEPKGDEYERWDLGCKLVADELADRIRTDAASFAPNVPAPLPVSTDKARIAELEAIVWGFLLCPEIADAAPEDKDGETHSLESRAHRALLNKGGE